MGGKDVFAAWIEVVACVAVCAGLASVGWEERSCQGRAPAWWACSSLAPSSSSVPSSSDGSCSSASEGRLEACAPSSNEVGELDILCAQRGELLLFLNVLLELFYVDKDVALEVHKSMAFVHLVRICLPDIGWKPAVNKSEHLQENVVVKCGRDFLVCLELVVVLPSDHSVSFLEIVDDDSAVLIVERDRGGGSLIVLEIDEIEEVNSF